MKWLLGIFLSLVSLCCLGLDLDKTVYRSFEVAAHVGVVDNYSPQLSDLDEISSSRYRSVSSSQTRNKADRSSDRAALSNSLFFSCRIWQSYIPVVCDQSLRLLIGKSIQVNAP